MSAPSPRVSVITTVRDRERWLPAAIESVREQSLSDWELVVWDDGSSDRSADLARAYAAGDTRIRVLGGAPLGRSAALQAAIEASTAPYIGLLDSDDRLEVDALAVTAGVLDTHPEVGVVYTDYVEVDVNDRILGYGRRCREPYSPERLLVSFMTFHFRLMRRAAYDAAGGVDTSLPRAIDYDLCLRLSEVTPFAHVASPHYFYRLHPAAISAAERGEQARCSVEAVRRALTRRGLADRLQVEEEPATGGLRLVPKGGE